MSLQKLNSLIAKKNRLSSKIFLPLHEKIKKRSRFLLFVCIPWALITLYLTTIKTPLYESTASILIHHYTAYSPVNGLKSIFNKNKLQIKEPDSAPLFLVRRYIHSAQMLSELQNATDIKSHYQSNHVDLISRLKKNPNQQDFLNYYLKKVKLTVDGTTGELIISVSAFTPEKAQELLIVILDKATQFLKHINHESGIDQSQLLQKKLDMARQKLIIAETSLQDAIKISSEYKTTSNKTLEIKKLNLKFAQMEYESHQQAYVLWSLSLKKNTPVQTSTPNLPDYYAYPKLPYDLVSIFVMLTILFLLCKMVMLIIQEHID